MDLLRLFAVQCAQIGCLAKARTSSIVCDASEMAEIRWFTREEVVAALAEAVARSQSGGTAAAAGGDVGAPSRVHTPGPIAVAFHLISAWAELRGDGADDLQAAAARFGQGASAGTGHHKTTSHL